MQINWTSVAQKLVHPTVKADTCIQKSRQMLNKEKCLHATPLSETALISTIQNGEGNQKMKR